MSSTSVAGATSGTTSYSMASLYVGDLHPDVTESMLFEKFSTAGSVLSIRVCRDNASRLSLGYAYVNFQNPTDAERALDTMNFDTLNGKPMRIMWSQRDPAVRRSGNGNIFIKNLDKVVDNKSIYDTFSLFGNILSCKVAVDDEGNSKGYGFVHFETDEAAQCAIDKVNGMLLAGKKVFVGKFQPRSQRMRELGESAKKFTNVFIKNFGEELDKEKLEKLFAPFGKITSCAVMTNGEGRSKGFGFVAYENPSEAEKAVAEMNDYHLEGTDLRLVVCRAQKKGERSAELKRKHDMQKVERMHRYQGVNLYVKNLDDAVDDEILRKHFETYGKITSAKNQRGFGHTGITGTALRSTARNWQSSFGSQSPYIMSSGSIFQSRPRPLSGAITGVRAQQFNAGAVQGGTRLAGQRVIQGVVAGQPQPGLRTQVGRPGSGTKASAPPLFQQYRQPQQQRTAQGIIVGGQEPLTSHMLAQAAPQEQKQLLGERIYALIEKMFPGHKEAGKITGMMLEIDNSELIMMLQDMELFKSKVDEAAAVLQSASILHSAARCT
uniref:PABP n=1 Tax=Angiostrongylus cantonensis TaxID=6313 RepID=A0A158PCW2_ANGCA